jgi:hypothetical protein
MWKKTSWHGSIRLSEKATNNLEAYMKTEDVTRNKAINKILESLLEQPQLEQPKKEDMNGFFKLPSCLYCPLAKGWVKKEDLLKECQDCADKHTKCDAWKTYGTIFHLPQYKSMSYRRSLPKGDSGLGYTQWGR